MSKAVEDFRITFPKKNEDGSEDKQLVVITLAKPLDKTSYGDPRAYLKALSDVDGVDAIQPLGRYTVQLVLANTFDFNSVVADLQAVVEKAVSAIIVPLANAKKITV
jgi:hypothetical protein